SAECTDLAILLHFSRKSAHKFFGADSPKMANLAVMLHFGSWDFTVPCGSPLSYGLKAHMRVLEGICPVIVALPSPQYVTGSRVAVGVPCERLQAKQPSTSDCFWSLRRARRSHSWLRRDWASLSKRRLDRLPRRSAHAS